MRFIAQVARDEVEQAGLLPDMAICGDAVSWFHARGFEESTQLGIGFEPIILFDNTVEGNALRARNMTSARHLSGFRAGVEFRRARIDDRYARFVQIHAHPRS